MVERALIYLICYVMLLSGAAETVQAQELPVSVTTRIEQLAEEGVAADELVRYYEGLLLSPLNLNAASPEKLEETGLLAARGGYDYFGTTLTVGPRKDPALVNGIGEAVSRDCGVPWFYADFKKKDGFKRSLELSRQFGFYRQAFCGCEFSLRENTP